MSKITVYSPQGDAKEVTAPTVFSKNDGALSTLSQAIHVYRETKHKGLALARTRGNVNRTTKKIYRQKGTGNARHGSRSAPIYVGGGVAHGPKGVKRVLTLPQKMRKSALQLALSLKLKDKKAALISDISTLNRSKEAQDLINKAQERTNMVTVVLSKQNADKTRVFRNLKNTKVITYDNLNAYNTQFGGMLLFDADIFETKVEKESKVKKSTRKVAKK